MELELVLVQVQRTHMEEGEQVGGGFSSSLSSSKEETIIE
jgi:hypothetical protein